MNPKNISIFLPGKSIDNFTILDQSKKFIAKETLSALGVENRCFSDLGQTGADLAFKAAEKHERNLLDGVDFLIFSSLTLDYKAPTTASTLHKKLNLRQTCGVLDLPYGCAAFPVALSLAQGLFLNESIQRILILFGEIPSQAVHEDDLDLKLLFGDAGVSIVINKEDLKAPMKFIFGTDSDGFEALNVLRGGAKFPFDSRFLAENASNPQLNQQGRIAMDGMLLLRLVLKHIPKAVDECLELHKVQIEDLDFFLFHQASDLILRVLQKKCRIPESKMLIYLKDQGNTVSCAMPIALKYAMDEGRVKSGSKVLVMGFGVGFSWCGTILKI